MSSVSAVSGASSYSMNGAYGTSLAGVSPDSLVAYCSAQLSRNDDEIQADTTRQQTELNEQKVARDVQSTLEAFGTEGPKDVDQFEKCIGDVSKAIAQLPTGDPVAKQLTDQLEKMKQDYSYSPAHTETFSPPQGPFNIPSTNKPAVQVDVPASWTKPTTGAWPGTIDAAKNLADGIKSDAEIHLLTLQDLVAQRQQAVSSVTGIMSKEDQTLLDQAKAIGQ